MVILGMDPDVRRLAYATLVDGVFRGVRTIGRSNAAGVMDAGYDAALEALMRRSSDVGAVLFLENIFLAANDKKNVEAFAHMSEVQGEILGEARRQGVRVERVWASTWHSNVLGFTRDRVKLKAAAKKLAQGVAGQPLTEHEADALCLALWGWEFFTTKSTKGTKREHRLTRTSTDG